MGLQVEKLGPRVGAKVLVDKAQLGQADIAQEILSLLEEYAVLVFPKIGLHDEEQLRLTDALGERVSVAARIPGYNKAAPIFEVTLNKGAKIEQEYIHGTYFWHMDGVTVDMPPPKATILSARRVAEKGGQTQFASTRAAYEGLGEDEKALLRVLRVIHTVTAAVREFFPPDALDEPRRKLRQEHPLVWTRANGAKSLIIGSSADQIVGMKQAEGRALLARLLEWTVQPQYCYSHNWSEGDCVIWDNTGSLHRVIPYSEGSGRLMHRTTIAGVEAVA